MQVTPAAIPRILYDITVVGPGNITLNFARNLDTEEQWAGNEQQAIDLWAAQQTRNALALKAFVAFDSIEFWDYTREDVYGVVNFTIMADFQTEWEPVVLAAFEADEDLLAAMGDGRLTIIWAAYR